ncbi:MAG: tRNA (adenosine(37)-N6)-threonylcarbamoyltransferase complex transferase subunit TsaD [bacterium]|nr:tRNA (adenosine(37)-N6)-threonylcarbamoyltransferase complex transferase subunit TsaD [bacterium]
MKPSMIILGIETSCDDTALALLEVQGETYRILSQEASSQTALHKKWGGVVPNLAQREHQRNLVPVLKKVLEEADLLNKKKSEKGTPDLHILLEREQELQKKLSHFLSQYEKPPIDLISVTSHPGLEPALWVGINFAKALSATWNIPLLGVDHLEGHLLVSLLEEEKSNNSFRLLHAPEMFPALALIVSGGHTALLLMEGLGVYRMIGETRDDAAGECFDKVARLLSLGYPGGPAIAKKAAEKQSGEYSIVLPRPMIHTKDYDFSFSGLKTAVLYDFQKRSSQVKKSASYVRAMAKEVEQAICDVLISKTLKAVQEYGVHTVLMGGGVVANEHLRTELKNLLHKDFPAVLFRAPNIPLCTDNGVMIAIAAFQNWEQGKRTTTIQASSHTTISEI